MGWTKQTKATSGVAVDGWGDLAWGSGAWGSPSGTAWTKQSSVSDMWVTYNMYDSSRRYNNSMQYNGDTSTVWTKQVAAI